MKKIIIGFLAFFIFISTSFASYDFKDFYGFNISSFITKNNYKIKKGSIYNDSCQTVCYEDLLNESSIESFDYSIKVYRDIKKIYLDLDTNKLLYLNEAKNKKISPVIELYKNIVNYSEKLSIIKKGTGSISINGNFDGKEKILKADFIKKDNKIIGIGYIYYKENKEIISEKYFYKIVSLGKEGESYIEISKKIFDLKNIFTKKQIEKINNSSIKKEKNYMLKKQNSVSNYVLENKKIAKNYVKFKNDFIKNY